MENVCVGGLVTFFQVTESKSEYELRLHLHEPRARRIELDVHNVRASKQLVASVLSQSILPLFTYLFIYFTLFNLLTFIYLFNVFNVYKLFIYLFIYSTNHLFNCLIV